MLTEFSVMPVKSASYEKVFTKLIQYVIRL